MIRNSGAQACRFVIWMLLCVVPLQAMGPVGVSYAEQAAEQVQAADQSVSSIPRLPRGESGKVRVFDNALLDRLFGEQRKPAKRENSRGEDVTADRGVLQKALPQAPPPTLLLPDDSFAAKITSRTPPRLAAALRYAEQGRRELELQQYERALNYLERAVSLGVRNYLPYIYYYLAQTHFHLAQYQIAFNFLEAAEAWLSGHSDWINSIAALRRDNSHAMGFAQAPNASKIR